MYRYLVGGVAARVYHDYETVLAVQKALKARGFDPKGIDGVYGPKTEKAIKALQKSLKISQTGVVDYDVLIALNVPVPQDAPLPRLPSESAPAAPPPTSTSTQAIPPFVAAPVDPYTPAAPSSLPLIPSSAHPMPSSTIYVPYAASSSYEEKKDDLLPKIALGVSLGAAGILLVGVVISLVKR